jgi:hypothetical protein
MRFTLWNLLTATASFAAAMGVAVVGDPFNDHYLAIADRRLLWLLLSAPAVGAFAGGGFGALCNRFHVGFLAGGIGATIIAGFVLTGAWVNQSLK